ncbi:MAG: phosphodiester glycosidase family protein [Defluviitaleaceae bacterium]|nr:phosphodiester glycosidase family protein [Defluviitaleaceae bacterium]
MKKFIGFVVTLISMALMTGVLITTVQASNIDILFERRVAEIITRDVHYHRIRQVTSLGFRDIHVLTVPVDDPYIVIGPAESVNEHGLRETVSTLLLDNGAVAGVNADFFGLANIRSASFGPVVRDGELISVGTGLNREGNEHATLYIEYPHNPFIIYTQTQIDFLNDGQRNIEIQSINKITDMMLPIIVNTNAMSDTSLIDERFPGLFKIVVENSYITYLSEYGETVDVPENGFVVVVPHVSADWIRQYFAVGQSIALTVRSGVDLGNITQAIGGGGRILLNGEYVEDGLVIGGRHPRTAVGVSEDRRHIIMMVIDGRGHSVGATHEETAELMLEFGAYNAMMLDGGGSSAMGISTLQNPELRVVNTPSEGSQRRVANALAVFNNSVPQAPVRIEIQAASAYPDAIYAFVPNRMEVFATDYYFNRIDIPWEFVSVNAINDPDGRWMDNYFHASRPGPVIFEASFNGMFARQEIEARRLMELIPSVETFTVQVGGSRSLNFRGIDHTGTSSGSLPGVNFTISDTSLGHMQGNTFVAEEDGIGYIQAWVGDVVRHVTFAVVAELDPESDDTPDFSGLLVPPDSRFSDFLQREIYGEPPYGSFDIVAAGRTSVPDGSTPQGFAAADTAARTLFAQATTRGLLIGESDWPSDIAPNYRWNSNYHVHRQDNVVILQMSAAEGGFFRTNREQWRSFSRDIAVSGADHVIVTMDVNPLTYISRGEFDFFNEVLSEFIGLGMSVFVVSAQGEATSATARDGIRYINLGSMWTNANELNDDFALLRIRFTGNQAVYDLQRIN